MPFGMMPGRPHIAKRSLHLAAANQINREHRSTSRMQHGSHRERVHRRVAVDPSIAMQRRHRLKLVQKLSAVRSQDYLARGCGRCLFTHEINQPLHAQEIVNDAYAIRAFRVMRAHLMLGRRRVSNVGDSH